MSSKDNDNPGEYRTVKTCNMMHGKINLALFGADGRGGMVKDVNDVKGIQKQILKELKAIDKRREEEKMEKKEKKRDYRGLIYSVIGGLIVAVVSFGLSKLPL